MKLVWYANCILCIIFSPYEKPRCSIERFIKIKIITVFILEILYLIGNVYWNVIYINTSNSLYVGFVLDLKKNIEQMFL